jgi:hypothetical protein
MTFAHLNRRTHLYLGLALLPWFFLYALSSIPFSHSPYFDALDKAKGLPNWTVRFERPYEVPVPEGDLRPLGARIVSDTGLSGAWGAYRQGPRQINVYVYTFWRSTQVKYFPDQKRIVVEDMRFRWDHFLTGAHARGGFEQDGWLQDSWAVLVDLVALAILVWILSGLYLWWHIPGHRRWGWLALGSGIAAFALFLLKL